MKIVFFTTFFIVFLVLILPGLVGLGIRFISSGPQPPLSTVQDIEGEIVVAQEFISPEDRLTGVALSLKNPNLQNKKDITLTLEDENYQPIRTSTLNGSHVQDGEYVKFLFNPVANSKDRKFVLSFSAPQANNLDDMQIFLTDQKQAWVSNLIVGKKVLPGKAVAFTTLHKPASLLGLWSDIYSGWLSRLFQDGVFAVVYLSTIVLMTAYLIFSVTRRSKD